MRAPLIRCPQFEIRPPDIIHQQGSSSNWANDLANDRATDRAIDPLGVPDFFLAVLSFLLAVPSFPLSGPGNTREIRNEFSFFNEYNTLWISLQIFSMYSMN